MKRVHPKDIKPGDFYLSNNGSSMPGYIGLAYEENGVMRSQCIRSWDGVWRDTFRSGGPLYDARIKRYLVEEGDELYDLVVKQQALIALRGNDDV